MTLTHGTNALQAPVHAAAHFAAKLAFETDPSDLHQALAFDDRPPVVIDARSREAYEDGHVPGAISLPWGAISPVTTRHLPRDRQLVTYCWGPGCNAATKGALHLAQLGFQVKEMIGGIECWRREGYDIES
jgi:rhodanese-related sulfurtransferase